MRITLEIKVGAEGGAPRGVPLEGNPTGEVRRDLCAELEGEFEEIREAILWAMEGDVFVGSFVLAGIGVGSWKVDNDNAPAPVLVISCVRCGFLSSSLDVDVAELAGSCPDCGAELVIEGEGA